MDEEEKELPRGLTVRATRKEREEQMRRTSLRSAADRESKTKKESRCTGSEQGAGDEERVGQEENR